MLDIRKAYQEREIVFPTRFVPELHPGTVTSLQEICPAAGVTRYAVSCISDSTSRDTDSVKSDRAEIIEVKQKKNTDKISH